MSDSKASLAAALQQKKAAALAAKKAESAEQNFDEYDNDDDDDDEGGGGGAGFEMDFCLVGQKITNVAAIDRQIDAQAKAQEQVVIYDNEAETKNNGGDGAIKK
jgi:hypothetical protein